MSVYIVVNCSELMVEGLIQQSPALKKANITSSTLSVNTDDGSHISLNFKTPAALLDFCKKHNFKIEDKRNA